MKTKFVLSGFFSGVFGAISILVIYFGFITPTSTKVAEKHELVMDYYNSKNGQSYLSDAMPVVFGSGGMDVLGDFSYAAEIGMQAVVHIKTQYNQPNYTLYDFMMGTEPRYATPVMSSGSGVIISTDGYIVTNNHVIENAELIEVILNNKKSYQAKLVGRDPVTDIALLKIQADNLPSLAYANSDDIKIGQWVLAIGNPFNLTSTVTAGIVSAKARNINIMSDNMGIESFIQTDAAVNPGNSGGALINTSGQLIGINTAIASRTGSFVGYSFAIPVNIVRKIVADMVEYGDVQRAYLGLDIIDIDAHIAEKLEIDEIEGVYVAGIWENGAGQKAGVETGDIILSINDFKINSNSELLEIISRYRPGEKLDLDIKRSGKIRKVKLELQNKYGDTGIVKSESIESLGAKFELVSDYDKLRLRIKSGIQVTDVFEGKFASNRIQKGYIIVRVNNTYINSVSELELLIKNSHGSLFIEGIYPIGTAAFYTIKL